MVEDLEKKDEWVLSYYCVVSLAGLSLVLTDWRIAFWLASIIGPAGFIVIEVCFEYIRDVLRAKAEDVNDQ